MRDEWTSIIADDLRQPIGFIAMTADFLPALHEDAAPEKEREFTQRIRSAANTLARMVDNLLDMSLLEADRLKLERKTMEARMVILDTLNHLAHVVSNKRVQVLVEPGLAPVFVDPMRVGQVLGNLISNAVKYGDTDAAIIVEAHRHEDEVEIAVTNHGPGIDPIDLTHIFNRFPRAKTMQKSSSSGLGLGLYIANGVVRAHGGRMWAESTPGKTTTFHLTLPTVASDKREAA